jgi:uncharacterized protein YjaZ
MRFLIASLSALLTIILLGCDNSNQDHKADFETTSFSQPNQSFTIVSAYLNMAEYVEKAREKRQDAARLYRDCVYDPIVETFASKCEYPFLTKSIEAPITDLEGLDKEIRMLSNSDTERIVETALLKISKVLPGPDTTVVLLAMNTQYRLLFAERKLANMNTGVMAITVGSGVIIVSIDPTVPKWEYILPYVIAHEYHHSVWTSRNFKTSNFSLLEYLVFEGRADSFAKKVHPDIDPPWLQVIGKEREEEIWGSIRGLLNKKDSELNSRIMVGDNEIPFGSGYTIGFNIMQDFTKNNPEVDIHQWTDMDFEKIFLKSNYEARFN